MGSSRRELSVQQPRRTRPGIDTTAARRVFHLIDKDRDEFVRLGDLEAWVEARQLQELFPKSALAAMFAEADFDHDGILTLKEFTTALSGRLPHARHGPLWAALAERALPGEAVLVRPTPTTAPERVSAQFERLEAGTTFRPDLSLTRTYGSGPAARTRRSSRVTALLSGEATGRTVASQWSGSGNNGPGSYRSGGGGSYFSSGPAPSVAPSAAAASRAGGAAGSVAALTGAGGERVAADLERTINATIAGRPASAAGFSSPPSPGAWAGSGFFDSPDDPSSVFPPPPSMSAMRSLGHPISDLLPPPRYDDGFSTPGTEAGGGGAALGFLALERFGGGGRAPLPAAAFATWPPAPGSAAGAEGERPTFGFASRRLFDAALRSSRDASAERDLARLYGLAVIHPGPPPPPARAAAAQGGEGEGGTRRSPRRRRARRRRRGGLSRRCCRRCRRRRRAGSRPPPPRAPRPSASPRPAPPSRPSPRPWPPAGRPGRPLGALFRLAFRPEGAADRRAAAARAEAEAHPEARSAYATPRAGRGPFRDPALVPPSLDFTSTPATRRFGSPGPGPGLGAGGDFVVRFGRLGRHVGLDGASVAGQAPPRETPEEALARRAAALERKWGFAAPRAGQFDATVRGSKPRDPADFKRDAEERAALARARGDAA
eukprot:tig00000624_g2654.t1